MAADGDRDIIQVSPSNLELDDLIATFNDAPEFQDRLKRAVVLVIPTDLLPQYEGPVFPNLTPQVFRFLREKLQHYGIVEAAILDEDYVEFEYRSEEIILPAIFIAKAILIPMVINLLSSLVYDRFKTRRGDESQPNVSCRLHWTGPNGKIFFIDYNGPASTFEQVVLQGINDVDSCPNKVEPPTRNE